MASTPTKKVQFERYVDIVEIPNRDNYTSEEISSIWLQKDDYQRMDDENIGLLERMINNKFDTSISNHITSDSGFTTTNGCTRGLEQFIPERRNRREKTKKDAWNAVIDEQQIQWASEEEDPLVIARVYRQVCIYPMEIAQYRGLMDEKEAQEIQTDMDIDSESGVSSMTSYALYSLAKNKRLAKARPTLKRDTYFSISSTRLLKSNLKKEDSLSTETEVDKEDSNVPEEDAVPPAPSSKNLIIREDVMEELSASARLSQRQIEIEENIIEAKDVTTDEYQSQEEAEEEVVMTHIPLDEHIEVREAISITPEGRHNKKREEITATPPSSERLVTRNTQSPGKIIHPAKRSRVRLRSSVSFATKLDVRKPRQHHFTTQDCWYSKQEIQRVKVQCRHITRDIVAPTGRRRKHFDTRGLEHMIDVDIRKKNLSFTIHKVLDEQDRQYYAYEGNVFGIMEPEKLAEVSKSCSKPSVHEARKRAHKDEQTVLSLWSGSEIPSENKGRRANNLLRNRRSRSQSPTPRRNKSLMFSRMKSSKSLHHRREEYSLPSGRRSSIVSTNNNKKGSPEDRRRKMIDYRTDSVPQISVY